MADAQRSAARPPAPGRALIRGRPPGELSIRRGLMSPSCLFLVVSMVRSDASSGRGGEPLAGRTWSAVTSGALLTHYSHVFVWIACSSLSMRLRRIRWAWIAGGVRHDCPCPSRAALVPDPAGVAPAMAGDMVWLYDAAGEPPSGARRAFRATWDLPVGSWSGAARFAPSGSRRFLYPHFGLWR